MADWPTRVSRAGIRARREARFLIPGRGLGLGEGAQPGLPGFPEVVGAWGSSGSEKHHKVPGRLGRGPRPPAQGVGVRRQRSPEPPSPGEKERREPKGSAGDGQDTRGTGRCWSACVRAGLVGDPHACHRTGGPSLRHPHVPTAAPVEERQLPGHRMGRCAASSQDVTSG